MIMSGLSPCSGSPVLTKNPVSAFIGPDFCGGWEGGVGAIFLRNEVAWPFICSMLVGICMPPEFVTPPWPCCPPPPGPLSCEPMGTWGDIEVGTMLPTPSSVMGTMGCMIDRSEFARVTQQQAQQIHVLLLQLFHERFWAKSSCVFLQYKNQIEDVTNAKIRSGFSQPFTKFFFKLRAPAFYSG